THGDPAQVRQPRDLGPDVPGQVGGARAQHRPHAGVTGYAGGATREKGCCMLRRLQSWARSWRTWALLLLFGLLVAWAGRFLWAEYHLRAARPALERRAYPEARAHLDRYLQVWPRSPTAHLLAARCARSTGDFDEAGRLLAACRRLGADREALALEEDLLDAQRGTLSAASEEL